MIKEKSMNNQYLKVSVIIPVYNEEKHIRECIEALVRQTFSRNDMEWIFIDGCSTDGTVEIIKEYIESNPVVLLCNVKRTTPSSLNMGIRQANGKYIIRLDAHTCFPPDYIARCVHYLDTTDFDNVGGYIETKASGFVGNAIARMLSSKFGVGGSAFRTKESCDDVDTVPFGAFRKEVFERVGLFNEELLRSEDNDMNARIRKSGGKILLASDIFSTYYCRDSIAAVLKMSLQNGNALFRTFRINKNAMSIRHFVPFLFALSVIILPILGHFLDVFSFIFLAEVVCYCAIDMFYSIREGKYGIITFWLYPLFHFFYGIGSLISLFGIKTY